MGTSIIYNNCGCDLLYMIYEDQSMTINFKYFLDFNKVYYFIYIDILYFSIFSILYSVYKSNLLLNLLC